MKRVLLGTTALVAAGLIAGEARAEFNATVNGYMYSAYGMVDEDDDVGESGHGRQNTAINQDYEVHFNIKQTLDNGITVGGRVELEGSTNNGTRNPGTGPVNNDSTESGSAGSDQIDEKWMYFRGGFGEIRVGDEDDARKLKGYVSPDATGYLFGVNSPFFTFNNRATTGQVVTTNSTTPNLESDSTKVIYFTPSFSGFQLAVSYAPDGTQDRTGFGTGGTQEGQTSNDVSVGADWSGEFSGVTIAAGGGYSTGSNENTDADPNIWAVGLNLGFAGFTVGGSVAFTDADTGGGNDESTVFDLGVTYAMDAITVGLGWSRGEYDDVGGEDTFDVVNLGAGYKLGEGILLAAFVGYFDYNDGDGTTPGDNTGYQGGIGAALDF